MISQRENQPSMNPADDDSMTGAFRSIFNKLLQDTNGMLPARVVSYDRAKGRAQVQPMIMVVSTDGSQISRAALADIPVFQLGGGNFFVNFKLEEGDLGWILANDRDISLFLQSYSEARPNTFRKNNFSDSLFIPHLMTEYDIIDEDELAVIQNRDGTVRIGLTVDKVKITAPGGIEIDGNFLMAGEMHVSGNITASGTITPGIPP